MMRKPGRVPFVLLVAALLAPLVAAGCRTAAVRHPVDDATITTRVKTALLNDPAVPGHQIDVDTQQRVVVLSGRVRSKEEEQRAVEIARRTDGVADVRSALQISP